MGRKPQIIVIVGPTASGKSDLAVRLALWLSSPKIRKKFGVNGAEVVSADSRQIYRGMNIGTGKVPILHARPKRASAKLSIPAKAGVPTYRGIPHHLLDIASPRRIFTVAHYQKLARRAMENIIAKNKIPIICGGTGFYIDAALYDYALPNIPPNKKLRRSLEKKSVEELFVELRTLDPARAAHIDRHNKRRLIRALEIIAATKKPTPSREEALQRTSKYEILKIGVTLSPEKLRTGIKDRLLARLRHGMIAEVARLHKNGIGWKRLDDLGLEYRFIAKYLRGKTDKSTMIRELEAAISRYAKRQMTWFRKDKKIVWIEDAESALKIVKQFLGI